MIPIEYPPVWTRLWRWFKRLFRKRYKVGNFSTMSMPLIKNFDYQNIAEFLVNVQPMNVPAAQTFYMDYKYNVGKERWYKRFSLERIKVWIFGKPSEGCCGPR